jgi:hypothetical protein
VNKESLAQGQVLILEAIGYWCTQAAKSMYVAASLSDKKLRNVIQAAQCLLNISPLPYLSYFYRFSVHTRLKKRTYRHNFYKQYEVDSTPL